MKLLIVTAIKESRKEVAAIFEKSGLRTYSVTNIHGVRNDEENIGIDSWFGRDWQEEYESVMLFSFVDGATASNILSGIRFFNIEHPNNRSPVKGIIVPIIQSEGFYY